MAKIIIVPCSYTFFDQLSESLLYISTSWVVSDKASEHYTAWGI